MRAGWLALWACSLTAGASVSPERLSLLAEQQSVPLAELQAAAAQARLRQEVLDAISRPWEAKPWHSYRPLFVTPERIRDGVGFWQRHAATLASQRRRRLVAEALSQGKLTSWDHQPWVDASQQYMRNHIDLDDLERRARYPQV